MGKITADQQSPILDPRRHTQWTFTTLLAHSIQYNRNIIDCLTLPLGGPARSRLLSHRRLEVEHPALGDGVHVAESPARERDVGQGRVELGYRGRKVVLVELEMYREALCPGLPVSRVNGRGNSG